VARQALHFGCHVGKSTINTHGDHTRPLSIPSSLAPRSDRTHVTDEALIWNRIQMRANQGFEVYHSKEVFITQKKLLDKAVLTLKYNQSNDL
jgi:hypothetical protein